jgi:DNA-binding IclR family transcriptional regulator
MYKAPIVKKAFQILTLIARDGQGMTLSALARELDISKSTVHGIAAALEETGAVIRNPLTKRYTPGLTLFELGRAAFARIDLPALARPFLDKLMVETRESVFLGIRNGMRVTILDIVESNQDLKITAPVGTAIPLMAGAIGKVFLGGLDESEAAALIHSRRLPKFTEKSIVDPQRYLAEIRKARQQGYALDDEEYISGVGAVAAPLQADAHLQAAIWVVGFKPGFTEKKITRVIAATRATAASISRRIAEAGRTPNE